MSRCIKKSVLALSVVSLLASSAAYATNGYFAHGYSTKEKGLAGAGAAHSQDALAAATNPAGMVHVGARMDIGAAIFNPNRKYSVTGAAGGPAGCGTSCPFSIGPQSIESNSTLFLIPHFGYNTMLNSDSSLGVSVYGNGGMNTNYKKGTATFSPNGGATYVTAPGTFGGATTGVNLAQLFIATTYAKKVNSENSIGASLIFAYQQFKADGLGNFGAFGFSSDSAKLTNNGDDTSTGFGGKFGWQGTVASGVTMGVSYQTKIAMSEFDDYAGLFAEQGDFDVPATLVLGGALAIDDKSTLVIDLQQIYYSDVASIANPISNLLTGGQQLGTNNGGGFGWDDMTIIKLGYEWMMDDMTMRAGVSNGDQPIPDSEVMFNILAPAVVETHLTFGMTMPLGADAEISFAAMHALSNEVSGPNPLNPGQTITLEMDQFEVQGTYSMKF